MSENAKPGFLTREQILCADDLPIIELAVPEWGGVVRLRTLTAEERDKFELAIETDKKNKKINVRARLAAMVCVDETGKPMFSEMDALLLAKKSGAAMDRIFETSAKANGLTGADIKELEKNSEGTGGDGSGFI